MTTSPPATILIVDNEIANCKLLEALLRPEGYLTLSAANGEEALAMIAKRAPDLILLDVMMPGMDGYQVAGILKANPATANIPIIMVTAEIERSARLAGLDAGAEDFLTKPVDQAELWLKVRNLLRLKTLSDFLQNHNLILEQQVQARTAELVQLNRVHAMLSSIDMLIVRARHRDQLFREACQIVVEEGGFRMTWIGMVDRSVMKIVPVASAGVDEELLNVIKDSLSLSEGAPMENNMAVRAVNEKKAVVFKDLQNDAAVVFSEKYAEAGIRSMAILPLIVSGEAVGVLVLCASETEFFHEAEMKLLTQLAGDIAFVIDHIDKQEQLDYLAYYDVLTGLANRSLFLERVAQYMRSAANGKHKLALFLIDLERFRKINSSLGRPAGDELLRQVAKWLIHNLGDANVLARVDADHFAVVLPEVEQEGDVARLLEKTMADFVDHSFDLNGTVLRLTAKVGVALFPEDGADADALLKSAEAALKKAKASGNRTLY